MATQYGHRIAGMQSGVRYLIRSNLSGVTLNHISPLLLIGKIFDKLVFETIALGSGIHEWSPITAINMII